MAAQLHDTLDELEQHDLFTFMCSGATARARRARAPRARRRRAARFLPTWTFFRRRRRAHRVALAGSNAKVFGVWRQKLHALLVSKVPSTRFAALWLVAASVRRCDYELLAANVDEWSTQAFAIVNVSLARARVCLLARLLARSLCASARCLASVVVVVLPLLLAAGWASGVVLRCR